MIVYFEDGSILDKDNPINTDDNRGFIRVDAGMGHSHCRSKLRHIKDIHPFDTKVYTNSLDAFSNFWCWDDEKDMPMLYIRNENDEWVLISELTDRKLRRALNLEKLYVSGEFGVVAT